MIKSPAHVCHRALPHVREGADGKAWLEVEKRFSAELFDSRIGGGVDRHDLP